MSGRKVDRINLNEIGYGSNVLGEITIPQMLEDISLLTNEIQKRVSRVGFDFGDDGRRAIGEAQETRCRAAIATILPHLTIDRDLESRIADVMKSIADEVASDELGSFRVRNTNISPRIRGKPLRLTANLRDVLLREGFPLKQKDVYLWEVSKRGVDVLIDKDDVVFKFEGKVVASSKGFVDFSREIDDAKRKYGDSINTARLETISAGVSWGQSQSSLFLGREGFFVSMTIGFSKLFIAVAAAIDLKILRLTRSMNDMLVLTAALFVAPWAATRRSENVTLRDALNGWVRNSGSAPPWLSSFDVIDSHVPWDHKFIIDADDDSSVDDASSESVAAQNAENERSAARLGTESVLIVRSLTMPWIEGSHPQIHPYCPLSIPASCAKLLLASLEAFNRLGDAERFRVDFWFSYAAHSVTGFDDVKDILAATAKIATVGEGVFLVPLSRNDTREEIDRKGEINARYFHSSDPPGIVGASLVSESDITNSKTEEEAEAVIWNDILKMCEDGFQWIVPLLDQIRWWLTKSISDLSGSWVDAEYTINKVLRVVTWLRRPNGLGYLRPDFTTSIAFQTTIQTIETFDDTFVKSSSDNQEYLVTKFVESEFVTPEELVAENNPAGQARLVQRAMHEVAKNTSGGTSARQQVRPATTGMNLDLPSGDPVRVDISRVSSSRKIALILGDPVAIASDDALLRSGTLLAPFDMVRRDADGVKKVRQARNVPPPSLIADYPMKVFIESNQKGDPRFVNKNPKSIKIAEVDPLLDQMMYAVREARIQGNRLRLNARKMYLNGQADVSTFDQRMYGAVRALKSIADRGMLGVSVDLASRVAIVAEKQAQGVLFLVGEGDSGVELQSYSSHLSGDVATTGKGTMFNVASTKGIGMFMDAWTRSMRSGQKFRYPAWVKEGRVVDLPFNDRFEIEMTGIRALGDDLWFGFDMTLQDDSWRSIRNAMLNYSIIQTSWFKTIGTLVPPADGAPSVFASELLQRALRGASNFERGNSTYQHEHVITASVNKGDVVADAISETLRVNGFDNFYAKMIIILAVDTSQTAFGFKTEVPPGTYLVPLSARKSGGVITPLGKYSPGFVPVAPFVFNPYVLYATSNILGSGFEIANIPTVDVSELGGPLLEYKDKEAMITMTTAAVKAAPKKSSTIIRDSSMFLLDPARIDFDVLDRRPELAERSYVTSIKRAIQLNLGAAASAQSSGRVNKKIYSSLLGAAEKELFNGQLPRLIPVPPLYDLLLTTDVILTLAYIPGKKKPFKYIVGSEVVHEEGLKPCRISGCAEEWLMLQQVFNIDTTQIDSRGPSFGGTGAFSFFAEAPESLIKEGLDYAAEQPAEFDERLRDFFVSKGIIEPTLSHVLENVDELKFSSAMMDIDKLGGLQNPNMPLSLGTFSSFVAANYGDVTDDVESTNPGRLAKALTKLSAARLVNEATVTVLAIGEAIRAENARRETESAQKGTQLSTIDVKWSAVDVPLIVGRATLALVQRKGQ
jgi:hypothetical protein